MSQKIDKNALKAPDTFQATSHVVLEWLQRHAIAVLAVCAIVVVSTAGWLVYSFFESKKEYAAVDAIYSAESSLKKMEESIRDERAKKLASKADRPVDFATDYAPSVEKIKIAIKDHATTRAAVVSALNLSGFLVDQKQYEEALAVLEIPKFHPGPKDVLGGFWRMQRGLTLLENQKADESLAIYKQVLESTALKTFHPEALLKSGLAYEIKGDMTKARETYEKLGREFPGSEASNSAQQFLRLIDLKEQKG